MREIKTITAWINAASKTGIGTAGKFLDDTRGFLTSDDLKEITAPILQQLDDKKTFPSPAIQALYQVLGDTLANNLLKKAYKQAEAKEEKEESKPWIATVYETNPIVDGASKVIARQAFQSERDAIGWADRYLTNKGASSYYAEVEGTKESTHYKIDRDLSMARIIKGGWQPTAASVKQVRISANRLSLGVGSQRSKPTYFSRG